MARYLIAVVDGPAEARELEVGDALEIGREPQGGLTVADEQVSRRHARLTPTAEGVLVTDLGSRNGTYVNERRLREPEVARPGDRIRLGGTTLEVREEAPAPAAPTRGPAGDWMLTVVRGAAADEEVALDGALEIGREPQLGLVLDDEQVSRRHARLAVGDDGVLVEDLGSKNGTLVNGRRIRRPTLLEPGDRIVIGETALELRPRGGQATKLSPALTLGTAHPWWTLGLASMALFMAVLDGLVVVLALPEIQADFGASLQAIEWTVNAFTLAFACFLLTAATLGDRYGRRRMFVIGVAIFVVSSALCALSPNIETLLAARAVQGVGAAVIMAVSLLLVSAAFPSERRGLAFGIWSGVAGVAVAIGPLVGGFVVTGLAWEWVFWLNVPVGVLIAPLAVRFMNESFGPQNRIDLPGLALVGAGLFAVVYGVIRGGAIGWTEIEVLASLAAGGLLLLAFTLWERRAATPVVALRLFGSRAFSAVNVVSFFMYFGLFGSIFLLSQFLQVAQGYSALEAGLRCLPWAAVPVVVAPLAGAFTERIGPRTLIATGLGLQAVGLGWVAVVLAPDVSFLELLPPFVLAGAGMGLFFPPASFVVLGSVQPEEEGQASGINNTLRQVGSAFGVAVMGSVFATVGSFASAQDYTDGVVAATWIGAAGCAVATLAALAIPAIRPQEAGEALETSIPAMGGMTPVTSLHAIVSAEQPVPQWELQSVPLSQADAFDPGEWEPFAVAQDRLYLRRPAGRLAGMTGLDHKVLSS